MSSRAAPWDILGEPEVFTNPPGGFDGVQYKWPLARAGDRSTFTLVQIGFHASIRASLDPLTARTLAAVDSRGRSEIERHLAEEHPPRVIEVGTSGDPLIVAGRGST
jgi:hypothetical protein